MTDAVAEIKTDLSLKFGEPKKPDIYEQEIVAMQRRILETDRPMYLPNTLIADLVVPVLKEEKIIGFGFLFFREGYADEMHMVDPSEQSKGVGMELVKNLEEVGKERGANEIHSFIVDNRPQAQRAMELAGYTVQRKERGRILYVKKLT